MAEQPHDEQQMSGSPLDSERAERPDRMRMTRRGLFRAGAFGAFGLATAALIGCGDDEEDEPAAEDTPADGDDGATDSPTPTEAPTDEDDDAAADGTGAESDLLAQAREQGFIRVGFANEAPYGYANAQGELTGEAPDVAREVLSRMGIEELDGVLTPFGSLIPGLQAGRFDMIAAGMFITPERCEQILFSDPDYAVPQAFGVEAGNPLGLMSYEDVAANPDVRLGVLSGAVEVDQALAAGVSEDQLQMFDDPPSMAEALQAGRIDAFALTTLSVRAQLERLGDDSLEATPGFTATIDGEEQIGAGGYGFRKENQAFRDAFNEILVEMKQNDEILPITQEHGFLEDEINAAKDLTAEDLCEA